MGLTDCKHAVKYGPDYWCQRIPNTNGSVECIRASGKLCEYEEEPRKSNGSQTAQTNSEDDTLVALRDLVTCVQNLHLSYTGTYNNLVLSSVERAKDLLRKHQ